MSCLLPGAPSAHTHACWAAFPPRLDAPRPSWTFFFLDTAGVVLGTEIFPCSLLHFIPMTQLMKNGPFFLFFYSDFPLPSPLYVFFLFENKSFVSSCFKKRIYLAVLGLCCCLAFSLAVASRSSL